MPRARTTSRTRARSRALRHWSLIGAAIAGAIATTASRATFAQDVAAPTSSSTPSSSSAPSSSAQAAPSESASASASASATPAPSASAKAKRGIPSTPIQDAEPPAKYQPPKRLTPDYDGRGAKPTTAGDVALWVPRLLVSPIYLTTEYLIRRPIGAIISGIEHDRLAQRAFYIFSLGGQDKIGLVPTFFVDFGVLPSVGLYFFWDDAMAAHNHVRVHAGTWGPDWINIGVSDRYDVGKDSTAALSASFAQRSDNPFFGLGPLSKQENQSRYASRTVDVGPSYDMRIARGIRLQTWAGVRDTAFSEGACCGDPSLHIRIRNGELAAPPRFFDGYTIAYQRAELSLDTRDPRPAPQSGVRVAVDGQPAFDFSHHPGNSWLRYGGAVGGFWDVTGKARVLSLSLAALFADPLTGNGSDIPFNEQVSLGGTSYMRGFLAGRLIDRSAAIATLAYTWPIWVFFDGTLQVSTGNVFGAGLKDFDSGKLRLSTGLGIRTNNSPDHQFEIIGGFGTDTIDNGAKITSFRLALGATRGF